MNNSTESDKEVLFQFELLKKLLSDISNQVSDQNIDKLVENQKYFFENISEQAAKYGLDKSLTHDSLETIFRYLRNSSQKKFEPQNKTPIEKRLIKVAFQGIHGAYSHLAAEKYFFESGDDLIYVGYPTFQSVIESVEDGDCDFGMLPIENTTAGGVNETYDLLMNTKMFIVGEEVFEVDHCLMANRDVLLGNIKRIYSHPQALAQCSIFLSSLQNCKIESFFDTAMAIKKIREDEDPAQAAIGSREAADLYGLQILKEDIANSKDNFTRFFIISKKPILYDADISCKTSLILATKHVEGALSNCLAVLAKNHLNLTKIQSRPRPNIPWEYLFYIDFEGNIKNESVKKSIEELISEVSFIKILGSYPVKALPQYLKNINKTFQISEDDDLPFPELPRISLSGLEKKPYKLASREYRNENTQIRVNDVIVGGKDFVVIAGPCSVESEEQIFKCAKIISENGGNILRGGVFKPRTSPYSFQGLGYDGLELLSASGRKYNLPIITEVLQPSDVKKMAMVADILQIGARNMQNFPLLTEVGGINKPVLLKRGMMASIDELLSAAEYILNQGNQQVILCERGIRTFETATRNTLDLSAVPILKYYSHLPVIVDPSHAVGDWKWIIPMVESSFVAGADGVMVEIHPDPSKALSDGEQSLNFDNFVLMMQRLKKLTHILSGHSNT